MKAIVKLKPEPGIWMDQVSFPSIGHNDVLIKVLKTAICGTDVHIYNWDEWSRKTIPTPMTIGHEFVGIITEIGSEVRGLKEGDRVSAEGHITCGHCRNCRAGKRHLCRNTIGVGVNRPGCFAEYISVPASNVFRVPDMISDDIAAILDPFGNAAHTALSFDLVGEDILITGAGPIGIMAVAIARHVGARYVVITDVNDYRLEIAARLGATAAINVTKTSISDTVKQLGMKEGFDVGLEMSGNIQAFRDMLQSMNYGGQVAILGIPSGEVSLDLTQIIFKGLKIKGIYGREMFETWYKMTSMLQSHLDIAPVITHRLSVDDFQQAFDVMRSGQSGKVIMDWA
ncbi:MAG: L-threonine 3-dehydrogenase [Desulfosarcina sp.]|nr:L-threonine 3-dehydrogenase [Desulfosarcina sp.]MBC2743515.1 L-threonine 3-dehydrogenase [Desulfosarcina sp.]MBC2766424.1 L-threonine 3-dehydrogenase [Desulfosarcina sp.]